MQAVETRHIFLDERGTAWIEGTGIKVLEVVLDQASGLTPEAMLEEHSHWTLGQIHAALSYYYDHREEVDADIEQRAAWVEQMRADAKNQPTRRELEERLHLRKLEAGTAVSNGNS